MAEMTRWDRIPLLVLLAGATGLAMLVPAAYAVSLRESVVARGFVYSSLLVCGLSGLLALATWRTDPRPAMRRLLPMLAAIYVLIPAAMALPLAEAIPGFRFRDAWFEMVSAFTTTGATVIETPRRVSPAVHLWRAMAGWAGGLFILVSAMAFLAPLRLGGFELLRPEPAEGDQRSPTRAGERQRLRAALGLVLPWYTGATLLLWVGLAVGGMAGLNAMMLAMSAVSTSGILPRETLGTVGFWAELLLVLGMALSLSRALTLPRGEGAGGPVLRRPWADRELRLAMVAVGALTALVVIRHLLGALDRAEGDDLPALGVSAWSALFMGLSFLTTTGFVSQDWVTARSLSGLTPPGLVLVGLTLIGGGVATTAGGVKLLRVHALSRLSRLELHRMIYPSIVHQGNERDRFLAGRGARAAWLFAMVFAIVAVALIGGLMVLGETLESGLIYVIAALTTTGPLVEVAGGQALTWAALGDPARLVMAVAMILGRLEILVILALALAQFSRD